MTDIAMAIPSNMENAMNSDAVLNQLRPRFGGEREWAVFLAFVEARRIRGNADEIWLQWDFHVLMQQAGHAPWHRHDNRFLPETFRTADAPIL
jgi:hypothetical protein